MTVIAITLATLFTLLSALHFYWAFGGQWALTESLPTKETGESPLNPGALACTVVGLGLLFFGLYYAAGVAGWNLPPWIKAAVGWGIPSIFFLRAIGEFRYVGFFKKIRNTPFGKRDTCLYSPLCLLLGTLGFVLQWNQ